MPDIETLRVIWWLLMGLLLIGFALTDGYDFGAAILYPFITRNETERKIVLNTIKPFWEGNQVWIILGAGSIFAAWPYVYAVAFSGFYFLILLLLLTMGISRPVSFKYRDKLPSHFWQRFWDRIVFIGGIFPTLIFGMLIGNVLLGVPFHLDETLRVFYTGTFFNLFNPFALLCGLMSIVLFTMHGAIYLAIKTENPIHQRAIKWANISALVLILLFATGGIWLANGVGYQVLGIIDHHTFSNPTHKHVLIESGSWLQNYKFYPYTIFAPISGFLGAIGVLLSSRLSDSRIAFIFSSISLIGIIATIGVSMFPFILPSSTHPDVSLLVWDASSSQLTLIVMLFSAIIFFPLITLYTSWVHYALRGKVTRDMVEEGEYH